MYLAVCSATDMSATVLSAGLLCESTSDNQRDIVRVWLRVDVGRPDTQEQHSSESGHKQRTQSCVGRRCEARSFSDAASSL